MSAIIKQRLEDALEISHKLDKNTKQPDVKPSNRYYIILVINLELINFQ